MRVACDSSVIVGALASWHPRHDDAADAVRHRLQVLPGHALLEAFSVLTRIPAPHRATPEVAGAAIADLDFPVVNLTDPRSLVQRLTVAGIGGGAVFDALIAATVVEYECVLLTLDRRARSTYDVGGARYEVL